MRPLLVSSLLLVLAACSSAPSSEDQGTSVSKLVASDVDAVFAQDALTLDFEPDQITSHGEAVASFSTSHLFVYVTFQDHDGIAWPSKPAKYTFHPSRDWKNVFGRDASGEMNIVEHAGDFAAHPEKRQDICNGQILEVRDVTATDDAGHVYEHVAARFTILTRFPVAMSVQTQSQGGGGGGESGSGSGESKPPKDPKQCSKSTGGVEAQDLPIGGSGILNGGCPIFFWNGNGCSGSCQRKLVVPVLGDCLWAGRMGTCTPHSQTKTDPRIGTQYTDVWCSCD
jgi:hypothetical protein